MAWRLHEHIIRGELDNRTRGLVTGRIWFADRSEPILLHLTGNCHRDLAGCLVRFENPSPTPCDTSALDPVQHGIVGDITASRKVRVLDVPIEEAMRLGKAGLPIPEHHANSLYLEWHTLANGRIVIESADYTIAISDRHWTLTPDEEQRQIEANMQAFRDSLHRLGSPISPLEFDPGKPLDEFQYEQFLRDSDARTEKYGELLEKYAEQPGSEAIIDREMGWDPMDNDHDDDETENTAAEAGFDPGNFEIDDPEDTEPLEPDPATEGIDWVRDENGHIRHPLCVRHTASRRAIWNFCKEQALLSDNADPDLHEMLFQYQTTGAKLAGALNSLGYLGTLPGEAGGIVARLKRALNYLHLSIAAAEKVAAKNLLPPGRLEIFRQEQFALREQILALMQRCREVP